MDDGSASASVVVVGGGIAGLAAAAVLAHAGRRVTLLERAPQPGGKLRTLLAGTQAVDAGPTVFTLKPVFEALFAHLGENLDTLLPTQPLSVLARHAWSDGAQLDLLADLPASIDAIGRFAGADEARRYSDFCRRSARIFHVLQDIHMQAPRPTPWGLAWRALRSQGLGGVAALAGIAPFATLMGELERQFQHPRLRQLFGRYATYCGSSPFAAPATLMLVAHAERAGVWRIEGGMGRLASTLADIARARGATLRCAAPVAQVLLAHDRVQGVQLESGEQLRADTVLWAGDAAALARGLAGDAVRRSLPADAASATRSLSAIAWTGLAEVQGFALDHHTVFFSDDGASEFKDIFGAARLPQHPSVYVCAQDRGAFDHTTHTGRPERLFWLVNAPATADGPGLADKEIEQCERLSMNHLRRCGLRLRWLPETVTRTTPADFDRLFPGSGGALYGRATHGWQASFRRPGSRSLVAGLWLAGGSVHPGPGLPMAATSGWLAAQAILSARASRTSIFTSTPAAMPGGTSTR